MVWRVLTFMTTSSAITASATPLAELSTNGRVEVGIGAAILIYVVINAAAALYGQGKGYPFFPLFVAGLFLPPFGFAIVLLVVAIAAGRRPRRP